MTHRTWSSGTGNLLSILSLTQYDLLCAVSQQPSVCKWRLLCVREGKRERKQRQQKMEISWATLSSKEICQHGKVVRWCQEKLAYIMRQKKFCVFKKNKQTFLHISTDLSTYRPHTVENNHSLFAHGCQGVWLFYISNDDVHLCSQLGFTCTAHTF